MTVRYNVETGPTASALYFKVLNIEKKVHNDCAEHCLHRRKNPEKTQAYINAAAPLMKEFGAEVVVRGQYLKSLLGEDLGHTSLAFSDFRT